MRILILVLTILTSALAFGEDHSHHSMPPEPIAKISDESIYNFEGKFTNQNGKSVVLKDFAGKRVLITMAYTSCQFSCPIITAKLKELEKELLKQKIDDVQIVLVSFDVKRDSPEKFKQYMKDKYISGSNWHLLRPSSEDDVQEIAALLGVSYKAEKGGEFAHSNMISLLDKNGVILYQLQGMGSDTTELFKKLKGIK